MMVKDEAPRGRTPHDAPRAARARGSRTLRASRAFFVHDGGGGLFYLNITADGEITHRLILTRDELRACADACLRGLGGTSVGDPSGP
jgi:hypothetical protein